MTNNQVMSEFNKMEQEIVIALFTIILKVNQLHQ